MPVVSVGRDRLFKALGRSYSKATAARKTPHFDVQEVEPFDLLPTAPDLLAAAEDEFQQLCFDYGIELDDVVSYRNISASAAGSLAAPASPDC